MADLPVERLGGKTLLQYAEKPMMDRLAREGRCGRLITVPEGFPPGSEVANTAILGYDLNKVYEGRGPLEAASIGYEMQPDDLAIRCNIITLEDGRIITHNGGNLETEDARVLIGYLNEALAKPINEREGCERVKFICGIQYRHLLVIKGGNKNIICNPPHDHPNEEWLPNGLSPQRAYPKVAGATRKAPIQPCEGCQGRAPSQQHLAVVRRLSPIHADPHGAVPADKERQRDLCRRLDTGHRQVCWAENNQGSRGYRACKHQLRGQSKSSDRGDEIGRFRVCSRRGNRRGWS